MKILKDFFVFQTMFILCCSGSNLSANEPLTSLSYIAIIPKNIDNKEIFVEGFVVGHGKQFIIKHSNNLNCLAGPGEKYLVVFPTKKTRKLLSRNLRKSVVLYGLFRFSEDPKIYNSDIIYGKSDSYLNGVLKRATIVSVSKLECKY